MSSTLTARLEHLFRPRSIAIIGASPTPGKRGQILIANLQGIGFTGTIYPINARYEDVLGLKCYPSLEALPSPPDVAAVCVGAEAVPGIIEECGRAGVRSVAVVSAAFADAGPDGLRLQQQMLEAADRHGISIMGPNGLGILNRLDRVQYWILRPPGSDYLDRTKPSGVSALVQSGSISMSIMVDARERGLAFDYVVSAGNQASIDVADYLEWLLDRGSAQKAIGIIVEGIGKPEKFQAVCLRALRQGTAIVVLKAGRHDATQDFLSSHTGALVGSADVLDRVLERCGAMSITDPDEWMEQLLLMAHPRRPAGGHWCMITTSGGSNAIISDMALDLGLTMPAPTAHLTAVMKRIADRPVYNPLDAGGYYDAPGRYTKAITGAVEDPALDMAIACVAWYPGDDEARHELLEAALKAAPTRQKPILVFSFSAGPIPAPTLLRLREAGLFPLRGCRNTLRALQRLGWWLEKRSSRSRALPALAATDPAGNSAAVSIDPAVARRMLVKAGLKIPAWQHVTSAGEAVAAAATIGRPVVLKLEHADLLHKTEIGAVVLGLADDAAIEREFRRLRDEVAPKSGLPDSRVTIQKQVASGLEMLVAIRRDRVFGTYLAIGFGGTMAELLGDVAIRPLPLAKSDVEAMLRELRGYRLLSGYRGAAGYDVPALVDAALRLGALAGEWGSRLDTLEINPLILHREGGGAWVADVVMMGAPGEKKS